MQFITSNVILIVQALLVLAVIVIALRGFYKDGDGEDAPIRYRGKQFTKAAVVLAAGLVVTSSFALVPEGHRGAVFDRGEGVLAEEKPEGLAVIIPFWQRVTSVRVQTQEFSFESFVQTKDLQEVTLPVTVNYHVDPTLAAELFQNVGKDYANIVILPAAFQSTTASAGQVIAEDIAQSRTQLAADVQAAIEDRLAAHGIIVEFVAIKDAVFDKDFIQSVKDKVIAEQKAEESARLVEVAKNEAEQAREAAKGQADAAATVGEGQGRAIEEISAALGFTPAEYLEWQRLNKWDGVLPTTVLGGAGDQTEVIIDLP